MQTYAKLLARAQWMRANPTDGERRLWAMLRARRLPAFKFKRQQIIFPYIVDFVSFEARLVVEADGSQHADNRSDQRRDTFQRSKGFRILRFWNNDILINSAGVAEAIMSALSPSPSHGFAVGPSLSRQGRGALDGALPNA